MRNSIARPAGTAAFRARITRWISAAAATASVAVGNSARKLSTVKSTTRPRCSPTRFATSVRYAATLRTVSPSSSAISRE